MSGLNAAHLPPDMSCRSRLATLNEKLTALERRIEYIEARVSAPHCNSNCVMAFCTSDISDWCDCYMSVYVITGDKRRDLDLELIMEIHSILQLSAHPPPWLFGQKKCDGFHPPFFGTMWTIFILYGWVLCCFISWDICIEDMGLSWVSSLKHHQCFNTKITSYWFQNILWSSIMDLVSAQLVDHLCCIQCHYHIRDLWKGNILVCQVEQVIV